MDATVKDKLGKKLARARERVGLSQGALAQRIGKGQTTISSWERGRTEPSRDEMLRIVEALGVNLDEVEIDPAEVISKGYPLIGKVGAGGRGAYADDWESGEPLDWITPLPGMRAEADIITLETDGDSMSPLVLDGDLAFFGPVRHDVDALLNKRVMARLADGSKYFKILKRGSEPGTYTLRSLNQAYEDIENVRVAWVLPYRGSRPRE